MAKYPSISQTKNGRILIAKSNATGKALVPIKVVTGDGQLTNQNIETMENVINPLLELPFASPGRFVKEGQFQLDFALSNEHLEHGFYAREIGVFAKLNGEDDSMAVMIAYTNGGNFVDYIPAKDTPINSKVFEITIAVDNAANVVVQRSDAAYITAGEMERHNTDANAHGGLLQKVKTKLATHNTDISSHPAITAMIAKILGATNWQENPVATLKDIKNLLGMGGIVAQRLEENGFVKFANGFTIQWGVSGEDGQLHSWILPYSACFFAKAEYQNIPRKNWNLILEYTLLNFRIRLENDDAFVYPDVKCSVFSFGISS
jgi:hypothetical protein